MQTKRRNRQAGRNKNNSAPKKSDFKSRKSFSKSSSFKKRLPRNTKRVSSNKRGGGKKMPTFDPTDFIKNNPVEKNIDQDKEQDVYKPKNTFGTFGFDKKIVETVTDLGITSPSPIQDQIIPEILKGKDVIGLAETGTGKTAAFLLPIIDKTIKERDVRRQTLILAPTRELAIQIEDELKKFSKNFRIYSTVCVGGMNIRPQIKGLRRRNHFIIGTPGRILDLIKRGDLKPQEVTTVVLDEADRMLDMGFIHDMKEILKNTPKDRETLFFSATTSKETDKIVNDFLNDPVTISVKKKDVTNQIKQGVVNYRKENKFDNLLDLLSDPKCKKVLIFGAMKHGVKQLANDLTDSGIRSESIHGNKTHSQRQKSLKRFKDHEVKVLVATDVAARGIHVDEVSHVINYDLPSTFQDYVHRIGRTGRGKNRGEAITFVPER